MDIIIIIIIIYRLVYKDIVTFIFYSCTSWIYINTIIHYIPTNIVVYDVIAYYSDEEIRPYIRSNIKNQFKMYFLHEWAPNSVLIQLKKK